MRHAHAVHFVKNVIRQVIFLVQQHVPVQCTHCATAREQVKQIGTESGRLGGAEKSCLLATGEGSVPEHVSIDLVFSSEPSSQRFSLYSNPIFARETGIPAGESGELASGKRAEPLATAGHAVRQIGEIATE